MTTLPFPTQFFNGAAGLTQGGWILQATEVRAAIPYAGGMLYGAGQWGAPSGMGPHGWGEGGQIYAQYAPPNGPLAIECQMPPSDSAAAAMVVAHFPGAGVYKACAGAMNSLGYARIWTKDDATNAWEPTTAWRSPVAPSAVEIRSMLSYTDSVTGVDYLFAGTDDSNGNGGIFHATYNANVPGNLVWNSTPELPLSATNKGPWPSGFVIRVMSFCVGSNEVGKTALFATVGLEIWERIDGATPSWKRVWVKPLLTNENSQSGLRALTQYGNNFLVFPEGTDWSVVELAPANGWAETKLYTIQNLSAALGSGFQAGYAIGAYNQMESTTVGSTTYWLIGLSISPWKYPAGTPIYMAGTNGTTPWLAQAYYVVMNGATFTLKQIAPQTNPTVALRFMVPFNSYVVAGGPDFEMRQESVELGWCAYDTAANVVSGA